MYGTASHVILLNCYLELKGNLKLQSHNKIIFWIIFFWGGGGLGMDLADIQEHQFLSVTLTAKRCQSLVEMNWHNLSWCNMYEQPLTVAKEHLAWCNSQCGCWDPWATCNCISYWLFLPPYAFNSWKMGGKSGRATEKRNNRVWIWLKICVQWHQHFKFHANKNADNPVIW